MVDGEIWLRGPQLFSGYRDDPDATAATLDADGWLHTGDLGHVDEDGYVTLTGRRKELIKVSGYQVAPAELEAVLLEPPGGRRRLRGRRARRGRRRAAEGVDRRARPGRRGELRAYVDERVAPYKRLAAIEVVDELPRTMTGKLLRRVLLERERTAVAVSP